MELNKNFEIYRTLMANLITKTLKPYEEEIKENSKFKLEQTTYEYILFNGFTEISNIVDTLNLIKKFIEIEPPKIDGINYSNYLNYHIHNYFQEMYILKERLKTYANLINRKYKKVSNKVLFDEVLNMVGETLKSLENICGTNGIRNIHVHNKKFSDEELNLLSSTSFLVETSHEEFNIYLESTYLHVKNKWIDILNKNNEITMILIENYFETLLKVISKDNTSVLKPF